MCMENIGDPFTYIIDTNYKVCFIPTFLICVVEPARLHLGFSLGPPPPRPEARARLVSDVTPGQSVVSRITQEDDLVLGSTSFEAFK